MQSHNHSYTLNTSKNIRLVIWLVGFYDISTFLGYLIPNPVYLSIYLYIYIYINFCGKSKERIKIF